MLLRDRRESVKRVLEIGIGTPETMPHVKGYKAGASLRMWRDYFPNATVYGLDTNIDAACEINDGGRISGCCCDPTEEGFFLPDELSANLIVDDGSHKPDDQLSTFGNLVRHLAHGGLYIIEDVERYALEQNLLSPHLPEHTVIQHHHGKEVGRCILIRG